MDIIRIEDIPDGDGVEVIQGGVGDVVIQHMVIPGGHGVVDILPFYLGAEAPIKKREKENKLSSSSQSRARSGQHPCGGRLKSVHQCLTAQLARMHPNTWSHHVKHPQIGAAGDWH